MRDGETLYEKDGRREEGRKGIYRCEIWHWERLLFGRAGSITSKMCASFFLTLKRVSTW